MSVRELLFERLHFIRERRRLGLPIDKKALAEMQVKPILSLVLEGTMPSLVQKTLDSLATQTYQRFEVILVSPDATPLEYLVQGIDLPITYLRFDRYIGRERLNSIVKRVARGRHVVHALAGHEYAQNEVGKLADRPEKYKWI
jgi:molybdopterin-guanine dinucleotide biosynthesis protein A